VVNFTAVQGQYGCNTRNTATPRLETSHLGIAEALQLAYKYFVSMRRITLQIKSIKMKVFVIIADSFLALDAQCPAQLNSARDMDRQHLLCKTISAA
jgi:hypothetical protein